MSDRTGAEIFAMLFEYLANQPSMDKKFAKKMWDKSSNFDFSPYQMYCDDALIALGLAAKVEDGVAYLGDDNFPTARKNK